MTPQERDLIAALLGRLGQAAGQAKDPEADQLIRQAMAAQPDAPYLLVQTVLIQDMALHQAQGRIAEIERQLAEAKAAQSKPADQPTSFLGGLFGHGTGAAAAAPAGSVPAAGPWSRPTPAPQYAPQQPYPQQSYPGQGQPMMAPGMMGGGMMGGGMMGGGMLGGGGGFLRSAATTAAGIAGGALLFEGIQSMFGQHGGGMFAGSTMQPGISETVINNYYENNPAGSQNDPAGGAPQTTAWDQPAGVDPGVDYASADDPGYAPDPDTGSAPDTDLASDTDFDSGGGGGDDYA